MIPDSCLTNIHQRNSNEIIKIISIITKKNLKIRSIKNRKQINKRMKIKNQNHLFLSNLNNYLLINMQIIKEKIRKRKIMIGKKY